MKQLRRPTKGKAPLKQLLTHFQTDERPRLRCISPELELRLDVGRLALGFIYEREDGHVPGVPAAHGLITNLAFGVTALLKRQVSRHHLICGTAIGTFKDQLFHYAPTADDVESPPPGSAADRVLFLGKLIVEEAPERP
jgi:hypothetical protein